MGEGDAAHGPPEMVGRPPAVYHGDMRTLSPDTDPRAEAVMWAMSLGVTELLERATSEAG
jgi:hypothetical protein